MLNKQLVSHNLNAGSFNDAYKVREKLICQRGDLEDISVDEQIELLACLAEFQFGRYLIEHRGLNGYWTQYIWYVIPNVAQRQA
ncbi:hypothetical protein AVI51_04310 [Piscirickettsia salmonis]|uniref:Uncharacterized protein n=1 Tax=Piscirickettsia salmonis TaxID=1238 RepID=A0A9Q5VCJ8_PISSA|nr:hypothetical protein [Piscirickettsia salmonis]ALA25331.1 hypothetical protein KW89_1865 [Piscirickettsia salmonis]APS45566.1 hypothetical protein AVI48_15065 [Piscirickettsia salmonis]APS46222.1 hypothetical protein AVI49_00285 [Piscirickettsia salmonis]APS50154.1 hypothetical protein AVI50_04350 [Piscirickettsia salmonis]APS53354.1 hypothetical protein AVI51_04310 [Piscirickettsia salmonis]